MCGEGGRGVSLKALLLNGGDCCSTPISGSRSCLTACKARLVMIVRALTAKERKKMDIVIRDWLLA